MDVDEDLSTLINTLALNKSSPYLVDVVTSATCRSGVLRRFLCVFLGRHFILRSDDKALAAIINTAMRFSSRVTKRLLVLQPFDFSFEVIGGKEKVIGDSLSRIRCPLTLQSSDKSDDVREFLDADS